MKVPAALGDFDGNSADLPVGRFYPAGVRTYIAHEARGAYAFRVLVADTVLYVFPRSRFSLFGWAPRFSKLTSRFFTRRTAAISWLPDW